MAVLVVAIVDSDIMVQASNSSCYNVHMVSPFGQLFNVHSHPVASSSLLQMPLNAMLASLS